MRPLYHPGPELVYVLGRPEEKGQGFISKESMRRKRENTFDDARFFEKASFFHLDKIEVFLWESFVTGLQMTYNLDGVIMVKGNKGKRLPKTSYELTLGPTEHIEFLQFVFSEGGIHEMVFKTNLGRSLLMDEEGHRDWE